MLFRPWKKVKCLRNNNLQKNKKKRLLFPKGKLLEKMLSLV